MELRAHDLVGIRGVEDLVSSGFLLPDWAVESAWETPWAVVRRAEGRPGRVPVGIRGRERGQRLAVWLSLDKVVQVVSPSALVDPANWVTTYPSGQPPVLRSLRLITPLLNDTGYNWGPTGSLGFELATGRPVVSATSDLDVSIDIPEPISVETARSLLAKLQALSLVRLDVQVNTPLGGWALKEFCVAHEVLVKTNVTPVLRKTSALWS